MFDIWSSDVTETETHPGPQTVPQWTFDESERLFFNLYAINTFITL